MSRSSDLSSSASARDPLHVRDSRDVRESRDAIVAKFTKVLPGWLRRCGVQQADIADAVQEALVAALVKLRESPVDAPLDDATARYELMRIVSTVALRTRRRAQRESDRYLSLENVEMPSARDEAAWVEARVMVMTALENLDEPTRALIYAHEIEGQTNVEIAATLKVKEDAIEKRVFFAKQRLRTEVEQLEHGRMRRRRLDGTFLLGLGFDSFGPAAASLGIDTFDRAVFGAVHEVLGKKPILVALPKMHGFTLPSVPTTVLMGALALAPSSLPTTNGAVVPLDKQVSSAVTPGVRTQVVSTTVEMPATSVVSFISSVQGCSATVEAPPKTPKVPVEPATTKSESKAAPKTTTRETDPTRIRKPEGLWEYPYEDDPRSPAPRSRQ